MRIHFALLAVLLLAGCMSPLGRERDNRSMTTRETCLSGCNRDSDMCMDEPSSTREALHGTGTIQGAGRQCGLNLGNCLDRCKAL